MRWPPYKHIFFDCDSTLTTVEGIDVLADLAGKGLRVSILTEAAMNGDLALEDIYAKRLKALKPTRGQVAKIKQIYKQHIVQDAAELIAALQFLGHQVYIISGGLAEPVIEFGVYLGVPRENIRAVGLQYNALSGNWWQRLDEHPNASERYMSHTEGGLTVSDGKAFIVKELLGDQPGRTLLVGDGVSDLKAGSVVDLFVGFGGVVKRPRVAQEAPAFINSESLAPLLALAAGPIATPYLHDTVHQPVLEKANHLISSGVINFQNEQLRDKFLMAWSAAHQTIHSGTD
ncbi:MAG: HAD-IB family phosphatase [Candidatus Promineifilaceae bacterium]